MGLYERGSGVTPTEQRGPSVCNVSFNREGKDGMTKASINLQDLSLTLANFGLVHPGRETLKIGSFSTIS
jgi:hypothetical protein